MHRTLAAVLAVVFAAAAVVLFVIGAIHAPRLGAEGLNALHALQGTFTLTLIASACGCIAIVAAMLAFATRR
jgi:hypothetical protein